MGEPPLPRPLRTGRGIARLPAGVSMAGFPATAMTIRELDAATPTALRSQARPLAALAGLIVVWGVSVPFIKLGLQDFPPLTLTALRYLVAAPCFALFLLRRPITQATTSGRG